MNAAMPLPGLFEQREASLAALNELARKHWLNGMVHSQGTLEPRLAALVGLRRDLFAGKSPPANDWRWPPPAIAHALAAAIDELGLARYCAGQRELSDTVLMSILFHLDFIVDYADRGAGDDEALAMAIEAFAGDWRERCGQFDELIEVFGLLPDDGKNTHWDQLRGLLRSAGWREVLRIRRLLERLPELAKLIAGLGRARRTDEDDPSRQQTVEVIEQATALLPIARSQHIPDMPGETRGVRRSDRIARMLPAEAMLLGHPRLRLVWHARRAERTLLGYEDDDRMREIRLAPAPVQRPVPGPRAGKRVEMGPMLVCVDTSGSMQGGAEAVAKAVVLEAMRTAHAQRRACHVFAFGGPDEVIEMELGLDVAGIQRLAGFLGQAFRGGTDICAPLDKALAKLESESQAWRHADLLIASDGEFGATPAMAARLDEAKRALGVRVQGVLIGDRETLGFMQIADHILPVRDWRKFGGAATDPPIHSHRLTALYFPGALRSQENLEATVTPEAAAAAVRRGRP
ncbi:MAG: VWA domain-containing protein [Rhodocyclaceae bacterium]|nr:VWA domain-containing protein [Rhodocyclaceae bacterium]MBK6553043.1 VWA domain-containing protein [Rhodocyclaceae bacterium]MBK6676014.1 VWA domain-containing protein [Rhodocyclaceae bacterium]MBK9311363.1 VWA domain-containing protein [Rhodocyclaceae bacterium]MBK9956479.1 VWA domain-containing protein [Rhodocyclaceae bacterium]